MSFDPSFVIKMPRTSPVRQRYGEMEATFTASDLTLRSWTWTIDYAPTREPELGVEPGDRVRVAENTYPVTYEVAASMAACWCLGFNAGRLAQEEGRVPEHGVKR